jgi:exodeoxyribonuclease VII small subunit
MAKEPKPSGRGTELASLSFEDALAELEGIVERLERGQGKLDEAIGDYERGVALKRHCEAKLAEAQAKIDKIVIEPGGDVGTEPLADA